MGQLPYPLISTQKPVLAFFFHFSNSYPFFQPYKLPQWSLVLALKGNSWLSSRKQSWSTTDCCIWCLSRLIQTRALPMAVEAIQVSFPESFSVTFYSTQSSFILPEIIRKFAKDGVNVFSFGWWSSHVVPATEFLFHFRNSTQLKLVIRSNDRVKYFIGQLLTGGFHIGLYTYLHWV